ASRAVLGAGAWSIIWFFLGIGHLYRPPVAVACVLVGVALGVHAWRRSALTASRQAAPVPRTSVAPIVLVQALALVAALAPPTAYDVAAGGYVDLALTAYTALAVRGLGRWWTTLDAAWLPQVAFAVGAALSVKLTTVFLVLVFVLVILFRALQVSRMATPSDRPASGRLALSGLGALAFGAVLAAPWYVRNWVRTGNPVFPFFLSLLGGQAAGWDLERSQLYESMFSIYGNAQTPLDFVLSPVRLALAAQPEEPVYYDGVLG